MRSLSKPAILNEITGRGHGSDVKFWLLLSIPIINVAASLTIEQISLGTINSGMIRAVVLLIIYAYFFRPGIPINRVLKPFYYLLLALLLPTLLSSDPYFSLYVYLKFLLATILFIAAYIIVKERDQLISLLKTLTFVLYVKVSYVVLSNLYGFGSSDYIDGTFYFGEAGVNITKDMIVLVFIVSVLLVNSSSRMIKILLMLLILVASIIIVIGLKRSAILSLFVGVFLYFIFKKNKGRLLYFISVSLVGFFLVSPLYMEILLVRYEARQEKVAVSYTQLDEDEGRIKEYQIVTDRFLSKNWFEKMFGSDPFLMKPDYFGIKRMIHIDYLSLLDGGGIIGLFLYLWGYWVILLFLLFLPGKITMNDFHYELRAIGLALIGIQMIMGIAGTITGIDHRALSLLFLGAICGVLSKEVIIQKAMNKT
ncbi:MAG: hypothetical protein ACK4VN_00095 [Bacteroidales bacterium]